MSDQKQHRGDSSSFSLIVGVYLVAVLFWASSFAAGAVEHGVTVHHLRVSIRSNNRIDVEGGSPSCQHSIGQVELLNLHPTDPIEIRSIRTTAERTERILPSASPAASSHTYDDEEDDVWIEGEGEYDLGSSSHSAATTTNKACLELPNQLFAVVSSSSSSDDDVIVTLGPGQVVMLPIAMLPRFPPPTGLQDLDDIDDTSSTDYYPSDSSHFVETDWSDMMLTMLQYDDYDDTMVVQQQQHRRNNYYPDVTVPHPERYMVSTTIQVETNRYDDADDTGDGIIEVPLEVSSVRQNEYGLPDTLYFWDPHGGPYDEDESSSHDDIDGRSDDDDERIRRAMYLIQQAQERDVYQARQRTMDDAENDDVREAFVVDSHMIRSEASPTTTNDNNNNHADDCIDLYLHAATSSFSIKEITVSSDRGVFVSPNRDEPRARIRTKINGWPSLFGAMEDALLIPADDERHYVVTVCCCALEGDTPSATPSEAPSLEPPTTDDTILPDWMTTDGTSTSANDEYSLGILQIKTSRGPLYVALESNRDGAVPDTYLRYTATTMPPRPPPAPQEEEKVDHISVTPDAIQVTFFATSLSTVTIPLQWTALSSSTTALVRGSVVVDTDIKGWLDIRLEEDITAVTVTRLADAHPTQSTTVVRGSVILWHNNKNNNRSNDQQPSPFEIPLTITVVPDGRLRFDVGDDDDDNGLATFFSNNEDHVRAFKVVGNSNINTSSMRLADAIVIPVSDQDALCQRFQPTIEPHSPTAIKTAEDANDTVVGVLVVRYEHQRTEIDFTTEPTHCHLQIQTTPDSGVHQLDLLVYSGQVSIASPAVASRHRQHEQRSVITAGMDSLLDWLRHTKVGFALRSLIVKTTADSSLEREAAAVMKYLMTLVPGRDNHKLQWTQGSLQPVLLHAGAISQGEVETIPIYIANNNPVPMNITIEVGEVEGMSIQLGRDEVGSAGHILDFGPGINKTSAKAKLGRFKGHPRLALQQFLSNSDEARDFFRKFPYRDDIAPNYTVLQRLPILEKLYRKYGVLKARKTRVPFRLTQYGQNECDKLVHPAPYGTFQRKAPGVSGRGGMSGPLIVSSDRKTLRQLQVCWYLRGEPKHLRTDESTILLPPGGLARFDVQVLAPPSAALDKDITQFVSTGLALSTNRGETIPIIVYFDALEGNLEVSHIPSATKHSSTTASGIDGAIQVPVGLFGHTTQNGSSSIKIPPQTHQSVTDLASGMSIVPRNVSTAETGVSLFMKSSFYREIRLRKVISCNPWFEVSLTNQTDENNVDPFLGVHIGAVSSIVSCDPVLGVPENSTAFPSFFRCALSWVARRLALQPKGCGAPDSTHDGVTNGGETSKKFQHLVKVLRRAILVSEWLDSLLPGRRSHGTVPEPTKSGRRGLDGLVSPLLLQTMSSAWKEIRRAQESGILDLGTSLHAVVEYTSTPEELSPVSSDANNKEESSHLLSLAVRNVTVTSALETPSLLSTSAKSESSANERTPIVEFDPTEVSDISSLMIPVRNPTAVPVRIRLAVAQRLTSDEASASEEQMDGFEPPFVHGRHYERVGPLDYANLQWWERSGAYVSTDKTGDVIRSHHNITIKSGAGATISLVNPSYLTSTAFIVGCGSRCGLKTETPNPAAAKVDAVLVDLKPRSPIGASAAAGSVLIGRPWPGGHADSPFVGSHHAMDAAGNLVSGLKGPNPFAIPFPALDEIVIPPFSETSLGPVLFRPPGRAKGLGCPSMRGLRVQDFCENQKFETAVYLENSLTGLEIVSLQGRSLWPSVIFLEADDHIQVVNGRETLVFPGFSTDRRPVVKEIVLHNDGDISMIVEDPYIGEVRSQLSKKRGNRQRCSSDGFALLGCRTHYPVLLHPGQNHTLKLAHFPRCTKEKEYLYLDLVVGRATSEESLSQAKNKSSSFGRKLHSNREGSLQKRSLGIVLGYEMNQRSFQACYPVPRGVWVEDHAGQNGTKSEATDHQTLAPPTLRRIATMRHVGRGSFIAVTATGLIGFAILLLKKRIGRAHRAFIQYTGDPLRLQQWQDEFLCLAKLDPSASELRNLGRERSREIMQAHFHAMGVSPPQSMRRSSLLGRDGSIGSNHDSAGGVKKRRGPGSDRVRASEGIFGNYRHDSGAAAGKLPLQLGWRVAGSRGIISPSSFDMMDLELKSRQLIARREHEVLPPNDIDQSDDVDGMSLASSYDELTDDDDIPSSLPRSIPIPHKSPLSDSRPPRSISTRSTGTAVEDVGWTDPRAKTKTSSRPEGKPDPAKLKKAADLSKSTKSSQRASSQSPVASTPNKSWLQKQQKANLSPTHSKGKESKSSVRNSKSSVRSSGRSANAWTNGNEQVEQTSSSTNDLPLAAVPGGKTPRPSSAKRTESTSSTNAWGVDSSPKFGPISTPPTPSRSVLSADSPPLPPLEPDASPNSQRVPTPSNVRPPPGLGPPPGFGSDTAFFTPPAATTDLPALESIATGDMLLPQSVLMGTPLQTNLFEGSSPLLSPAAANGQETQQTEEFDIMDFLDDILEEDATTPATASPFVPSNPWANTNTESRAAAYGIPINWDSKKEEEENEHEHEDESNY